MGRLPRYRPLGKQVTYQCRPGRIQAAYPAMSAADKRHLLELLGSAGDFYGFELLAYGISARSAECVIRSPGRKATRAGALERIAAYHGPEIADRIGSGATDKASAETLRRALEHYGDIAVYMKRVKMSFSTAFNRKHPTPEPTPPVWHDRYRVDIVEDTPEMLLQACAEVELLPGTAGDRRPPAQTPFCSFGAATKGDRARRDTIRALTGQRTWPGAAAAYARQLAATEPPPRGSGSHGRKGTLGQLSLEKLTGSRGKKHASQRSGLTALTTPAQHLKALRAFKRRFGHTRVPKDWAENRLLGAWVNRRRSLYRHGKLAPDMIAKLDALGFEWQLRKHRFSPDDELRPDIFHADAAWLERHEELRGFMETHGHDRVPTGPEHIGLSRWTHVQRDLARKGKLTRHRRRLLDELGFRWNPRRGRKPS